MVLKFEPFYILTSISLNPHSIMTILVILSYLINGALFLQGNMLFFSISQA